MPDEEITEWRVGRNFIRVGDTVKIKPSRPGRRDGFLALVQRIEDGGTMHVIGGPTGKPAAFRTFPIERIQRVSQTKVVKWS